MVSSPHLWTDNIDVARDFVLPGGSESLTTLVVGTWNHLMDLSGVDIVDGFLKHCPNLPSLTIAGHETSWDNKFGRQLEKNRIAMNSLNHY